MSGRSLRVPMIYVDPLTACIPTPQWKWDSACHLFSDHLSELHPFAANLGLKREWFQNKEACPHYDLTPGKRAAAIRLGAKELTREEAAAKWRANRPDPNQIALL